MALGLLEHDGEWHTAIQEAATTYSGRRLRELFVIILLNCKVTEPKKLWDDNWHTLAEDIEYNNKKLYGDQAVHLAEEFLKNCTLREIEQIFWKHNRTLKEDEFSDIPYPDMSGINIPENNLIHEEMNYDMGSLLEETENLKKGLNAEQELVFRQITNSVEANDGRLFFVYGSGGTGKTYLWRTLIASLRGQGKIVLAVASSGIASLLLPGGRTAHSRFKIPMRLNETSCCNVIKKSKLAELLCKVDLIIWDEAPMINRNGFEAVQRALADVMMETYGSKVLFGKKTVVLGGDFRQILPVIEGGSREDIVNASISKSKLNRRLAKWILDIGNGELPAISLDGSEDKDWIKIPSDLLIDYTMYPDFMNKRLDREYLAERSILVPKNECVHSINSHVLASIPGEEHTYLSADSIGPESSEYHSSIVFYDKEFLNKHEESGIASHKLTLKLGVPIMLLRNLNQVDGLCNGTRLIVTQLNKTVIEAEILTGPGVGNTVFIPRIVMTTPETSLPFILHRRQFPARVCYAMTINKSQGQSLPNVSVYLENPVFSHGQLYVAVSRTTRQQGLKILIKKNGNEPEGCTQNVVYKEIFENL
ncbi:hypothetical protein MKW98_020532 [Papaver atlanticum]|uniref:ATP-dependent DNA helicase n=1 Tax=Papaver atlanticum TaxID=357466 RepID=A0AAD4SMP9_9MAGN|nr:hypothetical protein MKW98_020532 [Papaver atlanticum]